MTTTSEAQQIKQESDNKKKDEKIIWLIESPFSNDVRKHFAKNFCEENFDFLKSYVDFDKTSDHKAKLEKAKNIYNTFLKKEARRVVNISDQMRSGIEEEFSRGKFDLKAIGGKFRTVAGEIFTLLQPDLENHFDFTKKFQESKVEPKLKKKRVYAKKEKVKHQRFTQKENISKGKEVSLPELDEPIRKKIKGKPVSLPEYKGTTFRPLSNPNQKIKQKKDYSKHRASLPMFYSEDRTIDKKEQDRSRPKHKLTK